MKSQSQKPPFKMYIDEEFLDLKEFISNKNNIIKSIALGIKFFVNSFIVAPATLIFVYILYASDFIPSEASVLLSAFTPETLYEAWLSIGYGALIFFLLLRVFRILNRGNSTIHHGAAGKEMTPLSRILFILIMMAIMISIVVIIGIKLDVIKI